MSSILDALKKAERESAIDRSAGTPWPAPLSMQSPHRKRSRRWWVPLGFVVGLCVSGVVFWQVRQSDITRPADSMSVLPSRQLPNPNHSVPLPVAEVQKPIVPLAEQPQTLPGKTLIDASPHQSTGNAPASDVQVSDAMAVAKPVQPEKKLLRSAIPDPEPVSAPVENATPLSAETALTSQSVAVPLNTEKFFKSDPRIELQALVWAPESAARFVVINNRLIKEGGSLDKIIVVRINPDDVLLAEGSDRWHEVFKIR